MRPAPSAGACSPSPCSSRSGRPAPDRQLVEGEVDAVVSQRAEGPSVTPGTRGRVGDGLGLLDVHEVAGVLERDEAAPAAAGTAARPPAGCPSPSPRAAVPSTASTGWPSAGQAQHRPLGPPRAEAAEAHRRVDLPAPAVGVLAGADGDEVAQPLDREARVHAPAPLGQLVERARACAACRRAARRWSSQPVQLGGEELGALVVGDVGPAPPGRQAVEVDQVADAVRARPRPAAASGRRPWSGRPPGTARRRSSRAPRRRRGRRPPSCRGRRARSRRGRAGPTPPPASPASASSGANTSKVPAKSKPPWASSSGGRPGRPTRPRRCRCRGRPPAGTGRGAGPRGRSRTSAAR